ncbi:Endonuclease/exonuclease/phosphatase, partial [Rhodofomes roseus]
GAQRAKKGRHTKASLMIGSLNICGRGNLFGTRNNKWNEINQLLREKKIGILALQETHLDDDLTSEVHRLYGRRVRVFNSESANSTGAQGVAFALNREIVDTCGIETEDIVPGRALLLRMRWHADRSLTVLNVYAPNGHTENAAFWTTLRDHFLRANTKKPDIVLGDFNLVEEAIDRLPAREDPSAAVKCLKEFIDTVRVSDGWRLCEPTKKDYSFPQRGGSSSSRLDRIYASRDILSRALTWEIRTTGVPTDHCLVTATITAAAAPYIGKGRWAMPATLLSDSTFVETAVRLGEEKWEKAKGAVGDNRTDDANPQTLFKEFKDEVRAAARRRMREKVPKLEAAIRKTRDHIQTISSSTSFSNDSEQQREVGILRDRLHGLERKRHGQVQASTTARYILNAECPSKYWSAVN